jgi:hypothetical protein
MKAMASVILGLGELAAQAGEGLVEGGPVEGELLADRDRRGTVIATYDQRSH